MPLFADTPHRRYNPLTGEWVLVSPQRTSRPWQGQVEHVSQEHRPPYDPRCYLCPGNPRATVVDGKPVHNPLYTETFVFDNDFPALRPEPTRGGEGSDGRASGVYPVGMSGASDLLVARAEPGVCRVVCFSPRHDLSLAELDMPTIRRVVDVWAEQYEELGRRPDIGHVQIFENKGAMMGASNPHPHGQIWAQRSVPLVPAQEGKRLAEYLARHHRTLLADYLHTELDARERIVCANDGFVALVPFWAVWPFETLIVSRRPVQSLPMLTYTERDQLADILRRLTTRYDNVFETSFPYSAGVHQAPTDGAAHPEWHLHLHFYPPLLRSATVRKFLVGYEMLGEPQRDLTPEAAAARLCEQSEVHYTRRTASQG